MFISPIDTSSLDNGAMTTSVNGNSSTDPNAAQDRFLTLLVAQLNNQDPMNPMDNAQMTSQMAQINTVTGIQQLNLTMLSMAEQFASMQALQGTMMIGRSVLVEGNQLSVNEEGEAKGHFELGGNATSVKVDILTAGGQVVDSIELGSKDQGRHSFDWDASGYSGDADSLKFRVTALAGDDAVASLTYAQSPVVGTSIDEGLLMLTLANGQTTPYNTVRSIVA